MIEADATARLAEFFAEIKYLSQFIDCDEVGVHTRGFQGETPKNAARIWSAGTDSEESPLFC